MCFSEAWQLCQLITEGFGYLDVGTYRIGNGEWVVKLMAIDYWLWRRADWTLYLMFGQFEPAEEEQPNGRN